MAPKYLGVIVPQDNFANRSKVNFGVGEILHLTTRVDPTNTPPTPMKWTVKSGPAVATTADTAGNATITCGEVAGPVILELHKTTGGNELLGTQRFQVEAPTGAEFRQIGATAHVHGKPSVGFKGDVFLLPKDVSFKWVETREGAAPYEGSGCFAKVEVSRRQLDTNSAVIHPIRGEWIDSGNGNAATGTESQGPDTVTTYRANNTGAGTFTWNIPWYYKVAGKSTEHRFCTAVHHVAVDAAGTMTISKLNINLTAHMADGDSNTALFD